MQPKNTSHADASEFEEKVVQVSRVSKKTKGGNKIGFSVLVVVGDKNGKVGVALGKGPDVLSSIKKAVRRAKKRMIRLPLVNGTIPFPIEIKLGAGHLLLKPAPKGTGVRAGGPVRAVVEAAGVSDIVSKILGSENKASNVYATFEALQRIKEISELKGLKFDEPKEQKEAKKDKPVKEASSKPKTTKNAAPADKKSVKASPAKKAAPTKKQVKK